MENFIKSLARGAGAILREGFRKKIKVNHKTASWDVVTEYDLASEKFIIDRVRKKYPSHGILAEETGLIGEKKNLWVVDPLDGTLAFIRGVKQFAVSIAFVRKGVIEYAAIYDPMEEELFFAKRNKSAFLNGRKILIHNPPMLRFANISMFLGAEFTTDAEKKFIYEKLVIKHQLWRVGGVGAALSAAYTACGRYDIFLALNLPIWDNCAGALLLQEAGAKVTDFRGRPYQWQGKQLLAANPKIYTEIIKVLKMV